MFLTYLCCFCDTFNIAFLRLTTQQTDVIPTNRRLKRSGGLQHALSVTSSSFSLRSYSANISQLKSSARFYYAFVKM